VGFGMDKQRILHAPDEIAGQQLVLASAMRSLGLPAKSVYFHKNPFGLRGDYNLGLGTNRLNLINYLKRLGFFVFALFKFDVFQFNYGRTLLPKYLDLPVLKFFGKKIVVVFHGCDVRDCQKFFSSYQAQGRDHLKNDVGFTKKQALVSELSRYADALVVATADLLEINKDFIYIPAAIDLEKWVAAKPGKRDAPKEVIKIVHSPTDREIKGTEFIMDAIENLKKEGYQVELALLEGLPAAKVKEIFQSTDIVVDQVLSNWYGTVSIEGMALGKPVIVSYDEELKTKLRPDLPVVRADRYDLEQVLRGLLKDKSRWDLLGKSGIEFVKKYHAAEVVAKKYLNLYQSL